MTMIWYDMVFWDSKEQESDQETKEQKQLS